MKCLLQAALKKKTEEEKKSRDKKLPQVVNNGFYQNSIAFHIKTKTPLKTFRLTTCFTLLPTGFGQNSIKRWDVAASQGEWT